MTAKKHNNLSEKVDNRHIPHIDSLQWYCEGDKNIMPARSIDTIFLILSTHSCRNVTDDMVFTFANIWDEALVFLLIIWYNCIYVSQSGKKIIFT